MADQVAVASSVYNLAGDEEGRVNFLKSLVLGGVMQKADSIGRVIAEGYRNGPALRFRRFHKWTQRDPDFNRLVGITQGTLQGTLDIDFNVVRNNIPSGPDEVVDRVEMARIEQADISYWVLQYLALNHPGDTRTYSFKYKKNPGEVTITFGDGVSETFPVSFFSAGRYLYARYLPVRPEREGNITWGTWNTVGQFPAFDGWYQPGKWAIDNVIDVGVRTTTRVTYSDGRPEETSTDDSTSPVLTSRYENTYYQDSYRGQGPDGADSVYSERHWMETELHYEAGAWQPYGEEQVSSETLADGTVKTRHITREVQGLVTVRQSREGYSNVIHKEWLPPRYFIYRQHDGNGALDALFTNLALQAMGSFYSPIPFRYDNQAITGHTNQWKVKMPLDWLVGSETDPALAVGHHIYFGKSSQDWVDEDGDNRFNFVSCLVREVDDGNGFTTVEGDDLPPENGNPELFTQRYRLNRLFRNTARPVANRGFDPQYCVALPEPTTTFQIPLPDEAGFNQYKLCKKAFKKAFGADFDEVQDRILDNESIADIDYIYAVFGVAFNVKEQACRKYVYKFFQHLLNSSANYTAAEEADWLTRYQQAYDSEEDWKDWKATKTAGGPSDRYQEPQRLPYPEVPWQSLKVESIHEGVSDYRTDIRWAFMHEDLGEGQLKPGARKDELWFEVLPDPLAKYREADTKNPDGFNQRVALCWQETETTWRRLTLTGLQHINFVYKDMKAVTTAKTALEPQTVKNPDGSTITVERESPFLVPLHETLYRQMSMVDATQMATACCFLVFNCYDIDKEEWYETWWFKVIVIVVIIALSVASALVSGGTSLGAGGSAVLGLLTGAGLSTTAALILAAVADVLAGLILSWVITAGTTAVLGDQWGPLIGAIISTIVTLGLSAGSVAEALNTLSKPEGWMALAMATGSGVSSYLQASAQQLSEETAQMLEAYGAKNAEVQRLYNEMFGKREIDLSLINKYVSEVTERPEQFLQRTLMTGSDIVDLTLGSIENFASHRLRLEMP